MKAVNKKCANQTVDIQADPHLCTSLGSAVDRVSAQRSGGTRFDHRP